jgi:hypothetical protein
MKGLGNSCEGKGRVDVISEKGMKKRVQAKQDRWGNISCSSGGCSTSITQSICPSSARDSQRRKGEKKKVHNRETEIGMSPVHSWMHHLQPTKKGKNRPLK